MSQPLKRKTVPPEFVLCVAENETATAKKIVAKAATNAMIVMLDYV